MGIPADPDHDPTIPLRPSVACPSCGHVEPVAVCRAPSCGARFFPQPGYSRTLCPLHDPQLEGAEIPTGFRDYKMAKARTCVKCGAQVL